MGCDDGIAALPLARYRTVGRKGLQKVCALIATGEKDVRDGAIDVVEALWMQVSGASLPSRHCTRCGCVAPLFVLEMRFAA